MALQKAKENKKLVTFTHSKGIVSIFPSTFHADFEIYFFLGGDAEFVCANIRKKLRPLDVVIVPAGEYHQFIPKDSGETYERCVIMLDPDLLGEAVLKEAFGDKRILSLGDDHRIVKHLLYLKEIYKTYSAEDFSVLLPAVVTDIVFLLKNLGDCPVPQENGLQRLSVEVMKYINANYKNGINLNKIADAFFVSVSTACHYFKEDFGVSIKQYIIEKKMIDAKILVDKGYKAQDICITLGFENYSTFFRAYKKRYGVSPSGRK